jgi:hypothetical protein
MNLKVRALVSIPTFFLTSSLSFSTLAFADEAPPSIPRPEGIGIIGTIDGNPIYGPVGSGNSAGGSSSGNGSGGVVTWYPGMISPAGTVIPPPLYNQDGTPYVEGISPRPIIPSLSGSSEENSTNLGNQTVEWFPGMISPAGTVIPPPLYNQDGTLYVEGVSSRPRIPIYKGSGLEIKLSEPGIISDKSVLAKINSEIKSTDIELSKAKNSYIFNFEQNVSAIDSALYLSAINKKSKKTTKIEIKIDSNGQAVAPTKIDLSKYNVFLKRGKTTLKKISVNN